MNTPIATRLRASGSDLIIEKLYLRQYQHFQDLQFICFSLLSGPLVPPPVPTWEEEFRIQNPIHLTDEGLNLSKHDQEYEHANTKFNEADDVLKKHSDDLQFNQEKIREKIQLAKVQNYFLWGNKLKSRDDDYEGSIEKYNEALKCCPKELGLKNIDIIKAAKAESYILWGNKLRDEERNYQESVEKYDEALRIIPNDKNTNIFKSEALYLWGCEMLRDKNFQGALDGLNDAINLNSKESKYFASKAGVLNKIGIHDQAITAADKALQLDNTSEMAKCEKCFALTKQGESLLLQDNPLLALYKYKAILKIQPENSDAIRKSFFAREMVTVKSLQNKENQIYEEEMTSNQFQEAINRQIQAINILSKEVLIEGYDHKKAKTRINDSMLYIYKCWTRSLLKKNHDFEEAIEKCEAALLIDSDSEDIKNLKARAFNCWGKQLLENDCLNYEVALEKFQLASVLQPNKSIYHVNIASALNKLGKYNEAIEAADKAIQLNNNDGLAKDEKMYALNKQGDNLLYQESFKDALSKYNDVLKIKHNSDAENKREVARSMIKGLNMQEEGDRLLDQAIFSKQRQNYVKALEKYMEALKIFEKVHDKFSYACELDQRFNKNKIDVQERIEDIKNALEEINKVVSIPNAHENIKVKNEVILEDYPIPAVQEYHRHID